LRLIDSESFALRIDGLVYAFVFTLAQYQGGRLSRQCAGQTSH
jgi:hypothetical protein